MQKDRFDEKCRQRAFRDLVAISLAKAQRLEAALQAEGSLTVAYGKPQMGPTAWLRKPNSCLW